MVKSPTFIIVAALGFAVVAFCLEEFPVINTPASYKVLKKTTDISFQQNPITYKNVTSKKTAPRCGEVLTGSNGGGVFYKAFELVDDYERCVWIIAAPNATGYTVNVLHLGSPTNQPESTQELIITGISWRRYHEGGPIFASYKPTTLGYIRVLEANILLVTFLSERAELISNGFAIQYQQILEGSHQTTSVLSTHHLFDSRFFKFQYPVGGSSYNSFELAAFVFLPKNNIYTGNGNLLWCEIGGLEENCVDALGLYKLNNDIQEGNEKWQFTKTLCSNESTFEMIHDDLVLGLFVSDTNSESSGFSFSYTGCPF